MVQLRFHPKMTYRGVPVWPPQFDAPMTDKGILEDVKLSLPDHPDSAQRPFLEFFVEYQGKRDSSIIYCDDPRFLPPLCETLKQHQGQCMQDIGNLDINF